MLDAGSGIASIIGAVTGGHTSDTNKGDFFTVGGPSNTGKELAENEVCHHGQRGFCNDYIQCPTGHTCMFRKNGGIGKCCTNGKAVVSGKDTTIGSAGRSGDSNSGGRAVVSGIDTTIGSAGRSGDSNSGGRVVTGDGFKIADVGSGIANVVVTGDNSNGGGVITNDASRIADAGSGKANIIGSALINNGGGKGGGSGTGGIGATTNGPGNGSPQSAAVESGKCKYGDAGSCNSFIKCSNGHTCQFLDATSLGRCCKNYPDAKSDIVNIIGSGRKTGDTHAVGSILAGDGTRIAESGKCKYGGAGFCNNALKCLAGYTCQFTDGTALGKCCKDAPGDVRKDDKGSKSQGMHLGSGKYKDVDKTDKYGLTLKNKEHNSDRTNDDVGNLKGTILQGIGRVGGTTSGSGNGSPQTIGKLNVCEHGTAGFCNENVKCPAGHTCSFMDTGLGKCCKNGPEVYKGHRTKRSLNDKRKDLKSGEIKDAMKKKESMKCKHGGAGFCNDALNIKCQAGYTCHFADGNSLGKCCKDVPASVARTCQVSQWVECVSCNDTSLSKCCKDAPGKPMG
ncbi:uncharacterized PE-PGRS family protein PE_PGRS54-like [Dreissena polymorpha]|uniref:uncharacterized PE-PGRS family protein PE_PGRS54-like n=1 Tax=Dreissena polymorpha TaxID=45954 RepID=UPI0022654938|nr:uncharacterized PE-PGRS family protein PE_PGRS54-like [Dreissena polymorpha]